MTLKRLLTEPYEIFRQSWAKIFKKQIWNELRETNVKFNCVYISAVNYCNAHCVFCGQHKFDRAKGVMSLETSEKLFREAKELGIQEVDFTPTLGDPLLDPHFEERVMQAKNLGYKKFYITTNGIRLSKYKGFLLRNFHLIRISIGGLDRQSYHDAYKVDRFEEVYNALLNLILENQETKIHIFFRTGTPEKEIRQHPLFLPLKNKNVSIEFTNLYDNWGGAVQKDELVGEMRMRSTKKKSGVPCIALKQFWTEYQGNVRLCGCRMYKKEDDDLVIGNLQKDSLKDILSQQRFIALAERFKSEETLPEICKDCTMYRPMM